MTLCWAVNAQGQGHRRDSVARCEQSRRSSGITLESIRRSEIFFKLYSFKQDLEHPISVYTLLPHFKLLNAANQSMMLMIYFNKQ